MIFTFICFLTSTIFWFVAVMCWKLFFPERVRASAKIRKPLLHEKALHSFSSVVGLLLVPSLFALAAVMTVLRETDIADAKMFFLFVAAFFVAGHYLVRASRSLY